MILNGGQLDIRRNLLFDLLQFFDDRIGAGHRIRIAFLVDRQLDRLGAAQTDDRLAFLAALADLGDIFQPHGHAACGRTGSAAGSALHRAGCGHRRGRSGRSRDRGHLLRGARSRIVAGAASGHQHVAYLVDIRELVDGPHKIALAALFQTAAGNIDVFLLQALDHGINRQTQLRELLLIDVDLYFIFQAAGDLDRGHAIDRFEFLFQILIGEPAHFGKYAQVVFGL